MKANFCLIFLSLNFFLIGSIQAQEDEPCSSGSAPLIPTNFCVYAEGIAAGATASAFFTPLPCSGVSFPDVWYSLIIPSGTTSITVDIIGLFGSLQSTQTWLYVYRGTCPSGPFSMLGCSQDNGTPPYHSFVTVSPVFSPETLWVRVGVGTSTGTFGICAHDASIVGIAELSQLSSVVYPNPASDYIYFNTDNSDDAKIIIGDINGTRVYLSETISNQSRRVNISSLAAGIYLFRYKQKEIEKVGKLVVLRN